jgi:hypothetical protein
MQNQHHRTIFTVTASTLALSAIALGTYRYLRSPKMSEPTAAASTPATAIDEPVCRRCSKPEAEIGHPLKRCAKCQSVNYCSRACQQAHWSNQKKAGRAKAAERDRTLNNPTKEKILEQAKQTNDLLR